MALLVLALLLPHRARCLGGPPFVGVVAAVRAALTPQLRPTFLVRMAASLGPSLLVVVAPTAVTPPLVLAVKVAMVEMATLAVVVTVVGVADQPPLRVQPGVMVATVASVVGVPVVVESA